MSKTQPTDPADAVVRKVMALPGTLWKRASNWRFEQHIGSEAAAIRRLIEIGLDAEEGRAARGKGPSR